MGSVRWFSVPTIQMVQKLTGDDRFPVTNAVCQGRTVIPSDNTYLKQIVPMAEKNALVRHCILAVAASYVLDWYFNAEIEQRANYHFAKALALLNDELKNCDFHIPGNGETLVASIILFCHIEVSPLSQAPTQVH